MKFRYLTVVAFALVASFGCNKPKRISDGNLKEIFVEVFLANSYVRTNQMIVDSIDIYTPILSKYGYEYEDIRYTFDHFSRRKSSKLTDILREAMEEVTVDSERYAHILNMQDSIYSMFRRRWSRSVIERESIVVAFFRDTARVHFEIDAEPGNYRINFLSTLSPERGTRNVITRIWSEDNLGRRTLLDNPWRYGGDYRIEYDVVAPEDARRLIVSLGGVREGDPAPHLRIDSLKVSYFPLRERAFAIKDSELLMYRRPRNDTTSFSDAKADGQPYLLP